MTCDKLSGHLIYVPLSPSTGHRSAYEQAARACPHCGSSVISRKGVRKKKLEIVQLWRCGSCKRGFTPGPAALRNKTYPIRLVLQALTLYDLGYSLNETAKRLKSKSGRAISPATIAMWIGAHKDQTTFRRLRAEATTIYPPSKPSARSSFITGRSTPTRIIARSLPSCAAIRSIGASRHSRHSSRTFHQLARMNSSAARTIPRPALRRRARLSPIPTASSSTAKRTRPRQLPASSFPPWVPTSCDTRHCKISCSRTTRVRSRSRFPSGSPKTRSAHSKRAMASSSRRVGAAQHHRPHRFSASQERRYSRSRLQTGRTHQQADRAARDLCAGTHHPRAGPQTLRHQMRVV